MAKKNLITIITLILTIVGLIFIAAASPPEANNLFGDQYYFIKRQLFWVTIGLALYFSLSRLNPNSIQKYLPFTYLISVISLVIVLIPSFGQKALGARRWLEIGNLTVQPAEIFKLVAILFFAWLFSQQDKNLKKMLFCLLPPVLAIIFQPNLSTAIIIILVTISVYYLSGAKIVPLFTFSLFAAIISLILVFTSPYRLNRLQVLLKPTDQNSSLSYHSNQIILAISSGGFFGKGLANSEQKYRFLPKIPTDSILAVIGEETGFVGITTIFLLYLLLITKIFSISQKLPSTYDSLIVAGVGCWLAYQSLVNIASLASLIPLTGIPLPLISYGGSSTTSLLAALGLTHFYEKQI